MSEPTTPTNTPADVPHFDACTGREPPAKTSQIEEESRLVKNHTDSSLSILSDSSIGRACVENELFAYVPAFQVSAKLKHSSAEQRENPSDQPTKTKEEEGATQCQTSDDCDDSNLTNAEEKNNTTHITHLFKYPQSTLLETSQGGQGVLEQNKLHRIDNQDTYLGKSSGGAHHNPRGIHQLPSNTGPIIRDVTLLYYVTPVMYNPRHNAEIKDFAKDNRVSHRDHDEQQTIHTSFIGKLRDSGM